MTDQTAPGAAAAMRRHPRSTAIEAGRVAACAALLSVAAAACGASHGDAARPTTTSASSSAPATSAAPTSRPRTTVAAKTRAAAAWQGNPAGGTTATDAELATAIDTVPAFEHQQPLDGVVADALADLNGYWSIVMPELYDQPWKPISGGFYPYTSTSALPPCPGVREYADIAQNAFYCPGGDLVAWDDENLMPALDQQYGDFTLAIVMAHEIGHAVQARIGDEATETITKEEQADCFAGAWVASVANGHSKRFDVRLDDLDAAVAGFLVLRDEPGSSARSAGAHGSAFDRIGSFQEGYEDGARSCQAYTDDTVARRLVQTPFTSDADAQRGGNLPWEDVLPLVSADLESFWSTVFAQGGTTWTPIDPTTRADGALARRLYDDIGDFAAATLLGRAYASVVQERLHEPGSPLAQSLQADCLTGTWAASMFLHDRPDAKLRMSPGDLDKAVMALLVSGDSAAAVRGGTATVGSPFQRVEALRTGFLDGISECAKITERQ